MRRRRPALRGAGAAGMAVLAAAPVLVLAGCGGAASSALESLASRASSAIASATSALPSAPTKTSEPTRTTEAPTPSATTQTPETTSPTPDPSTTTPAPTTATPTETRTTTQTATETRTATVTVSPTTSSATPTSASPTSASPRSPSPSGSAAPAPASSGGPWLWVLIVAALAALGGLIAWLVARSRRASAWKDGLRTATASFDQLTGSFLPQLIASPSDPSLAATWAVVRPQAAEGQRAAEALATTAPGDAERAAASALAAAAGSVTGAVDVCLAPGTFVDPASVQEVVRRRDALVGAVADARTVAGPAAGGRHT